MTMFVCSCGVSFPNTVELQLHEMGCNKGTTRKSRREKSLPRRFTDYEIDTPDDKGAITAAEEDQKPGSGVVEVIQMKALVEEGENTKELTPTKLESIVDLTAGTEELNISRALVENVVDILDVLDDLDGMLEESQTNITFRTVCDEVPSDTTATEITTTPIKHVDIAVREDGETSETSEFYDMQNQIKMLKNIISTKEKEIDSLLKRIEDGKKMEEDLERINKEAENLRNKLELQREETRRKERACNDKEMKLSRQEKELKREREEKKELMKIIEGEKSKRIEQEMMNDAMKILAEETTKEIGRLKEETMKMKEKTTIEAKQKETELARLKEETQKEKEQIIAEMKRKETELTKWKEKVMSTGEETNIKLLQERKEQTERISELTKELSLTKASEQKACSNVSELISELRCRGEEITFKEEEANKLMGMFNISQENMTRLEQNLKQVRDENTQIENKLKQMNQNSNTPGGASTRSAE